MKIAPTGRRIQKKTPPAARPPQRAARPQPASIPTSTFASLLVVVVAMCGGIAALGFRHRREELALAAANDAKAPAPTPPEVLPPAPRPPALLSDPTAEPTHTLRGRITFDADHRMIITAEDAAETVISRERLEQSILRFHRDDQAKAWWLDLTDGSRIDLDRETAAGLAKSLPLRFTYTRDD